MVKISYGRHVFCTLTFRQDNISPSKALQNTTRAYNRYITNIRRRLWSDCQYLRSVELHKSGYPHLHAILQRPAAGIEIQKDSRGRLWLNDNVHAVLKGSWPAISDHQIPYSKSGALRYCLKYAVKNASASTAWKKVFATEDLKKAAASGAAVASHIGSKSTAAPPAPVWIPFGPGKHDRIKLLSWSRKFDFGPFYTPASK